MINDGVKMNILKILMNTQFTPLDASDETFYGGGKHAKIGDYRDMVVVIDGTSKNPSSIEVFYKSGKCIYSGYVTKDGLSIRQYDESGHRHRS